MAHFADGVAGRVVDDHLRYQEYLSAQILQTAVELIVLIAHQVGVKLACLLKHFALVTAEGHRIGLHDLRGSNLVHRRRDGSRPTRWHGRQPYL